MLATPPQPRLTAPSAGIAPKRNSNPQQRTSLKSPRRKRAFKKTLIRYGLVAANLLIVGLVGHMVFVYSGNQSTSYGVHSTTADAGSNPLDSLSAAEVAANVAKLAGLPEELAVTNQADTINLYLQAAVIEKEYVTKSQVLSAEVKSKADIKKHVVVDGQTLASLATHFGVTSDSIMWSNNLTVDRLTAGQELTIPPVNGFVYQVGVGDTPDKLAEMYQANAAEIAAFNDAEVKGLVAGDMIVIPNGVKQRLPSVLKFKANYGQNGYWRGYCTWYVATKITVPNNWGNANTWDNRAKATDGWVVSRVPVVGAIAQSNSGPEGHVAVVEAVSEDGNMIKYSDMNGLAGWGRAGYSEWVPSTSRFQNFIYRAQ